MTKNTIPAWKIAHMLENLSEALGYEQTLRTVARDSGIDALMACINLKVCIEIVREGLAAAALTDVAVEA